MNYIIALPFRWDSLLCLQRMRWGLLSKWRGAWYKYPPIAIKMDYNCPECTLRVYVFRAWVHIYPNKNGWIVSRRKKASDKLVKERFKSNQ